MKNKRALLLILADTDFLEAKINELKNLCATIDIEVIAVFTQSLKERRIGLFGKGKIQEIVNLGLDIDCVITYQRLTPIDSRVLYDAFDVPVMDKMRVILEIFALRASSKLAKMEVELAQKIVERDDLVGNYQQLSRQAGSSGEMHSRGAGEQQLQLDRRHINRSIGRLKKEIAREQRKQQHSNQRAKDNQLFHVALVGYTNAGKSTLMNYLLSQSKVNKLHKQVTSKDQVFSSLDTTTRKIEIEGYPSFLLVDTVGFVMDLPSELIASFNSTLSIIDTVDLVVVVLDRAYDIHVQLESVQPYLAKLESENVCVVLNKIDTVSENHTLYLGISAKNGQGVDQLLDVIKAKKLENYEYHQGYVHPMHVHEFYEAEAFVFVQQQIDIGDWVYMKVYIDQKKKHLLQFLHYENPTYTGFS